MAVSLDGIHNQGVHKMDLSISLTAAQRKKLQQARDEARRAGCCKMQNRCIAILGCAKGLQVNSLADLLGVTLSTIYNWIHEFLNGDIEDLKLQVSPGRPPLLTDRQQEELKQMIIAGPAASGFPGACWRTPMIAFLIRREFDVDFSVKYLSEYLHVLGFSFQKAKFNAAKKDEKNRKHWLRKTWPEILNLAKRKNAHIMFGDEASFPQWGTLNYTWSPIGEQPVVETSGSRKSYKVFGLIEYETGRFFAKGVEGKLNAESYSAFLTEVLKKTRKHIILIQDGAPYHEGSVMKDFFDRHKHRLTVYKLPAYSPDYNPIEKIWKKAKQAGTHLQYFPTFESLVEKVDEMLDLFAESAKQVLSILGFYKNAKAR